jgi:hypothetical protein
MSRSTYAQPDTQEAYLFQCGDNGLYAVSIDSSGSNLPLSVCPTGWRFRREFALGVQAPVPASIPPEPILRGIRRFGYYVWREGVPHGTTQ